MSAAPTVPPVVCTPLIAPPWRAATAAAAIAALAGLVALSIALHDRPTGTAFDDSLMRWLLAHVGNTGQRMLLWLSEPGLDVGLLAVVAVGAVLVKAWDVAVLAVVSPAVATVLSELILKPLVNRRFGLVQELSHGIVAAGYAFPSGHETGLASLTTVLLVVVGRLPLRRVAQVCCAVVLVLWTLAGAIGLVRSYYHYATDTVGGICVAVACVLALALLLDAVVPAMERRRRQLT